jgi:hypothetical protein
MQRLIPSLDIQLVRVGDKSALLVDYTQINRQVNRLGLHFFKNEGKIGKTFKKTFLNLWVNCKKLTMFGSLYYSQFFHLFKKIKSRLVTKDRLFDSFNQYFSNTTGIGNYDLLAYSSQVNYTAISGVFSNLLLNNAGFAFNGMNVKSTFVAKNAAPRFKSEERGDAMA